MLVRVPEDVLLVVLLGMIDAAGECGRVGGGVATVDAALLQQLEAWQDETTVV